MHQLCHAVKYMNDKGIVHRDLKPENILCVHPHSVQHIKLCDFGISKVLKRSHFKQAVMPTYTAPEVLRHKQSYDYTVDYWR